MKIIKTSEALPKSGRYVLAWLEGAKIPMRAMWAAQHTLPLGDDADPEWGEYSEEKDEYFCPAGWYEMNQHEEQHWGVDGNVVAWCELPRLDHQCLAQIEEPAQPVAEICSASHDDAEFGERAIKPLCDISSFEYGTPLYAGAAPAAVAPQGVTAWMHPETRDVISDAKKHEMSTQYGTETRRKAEGYSVAMAPVEQSAAAPALEASAASNGEQLDGVVRQKLGALLNAFGEAQWQAGRGVPCPSIEDAFEAVISATVALLAAAPQAPAAPWKDHQTARLVNDLRDCAIKYHGAGQLRERIAHIVVPLCDQLKGALAAPAAPAVDATSDTALLDAMQRHRIALVPEFEGPWDAEIFNDEAEAPLIASGNTPREALHAALAAQAKEGGAA